MSNQSEGPPKPPAETQLSEEEISGLISGARNFEELLAAIDKIGVLKSTTTGKEYSAEELRQQIESLDSIRKSLREGEERLNSPVVVGTLRYFTRAGDLRAKIYELLKAETTSEK